MSSDNHRYLESHQTSDDFDDKTDLLTEGKQSVNQPAFNKWTSVRVMYLTMFLSSMAFSIVLSSLWPFLRTVDKDATPTILGVVVASFSLGQLLGSPVFGYWANRRQSKEPVVVSCILALVGNCMYGYSGSLSEHNIFNAITMMSARFIVGFGAGNVAITRSFVSHSTTLEERTAAMANMSIAQALGFIIGPAIGLAFVPLGEDGVQVSAIYFQLNIYTAPGFLGATLALLNVVFVLVFFREHVNIVAVPDSDSLTPSIQVTGDSGYSASHLKMDKLAVIGCIGLFFIVLFVFTVFETLTTPLSMDEYAWSSVQATFYNGILFAVAAVISVVTFLLAKPLSRKVDERTLLVVGFIIIACGIVVLLPWSKESPAVMASFIDTNPTVKVTSTATEPTFLPFNTEAASSSRGCPLQYRWCINSSKVLIQQFFAGAVLISIGYPVSSLMTYSLYSKILGERKQGTMMGWLTASGSLARTLGPVFVSSVYHRFGPRWTFVSSGVIVAIALLALWYLYRRLVPFHLNFRINGLQHY
ncbi:major facilitator superfamily domain-containing protein 8-like [Corticium candelabrum]|uniref:major facilitator superfamily domain-containing protein 8-like n=1 Tax=Corticium candelabrum TaxID=121492 RepID=UPI002E272D96|nr:major facilitator superfamily domain-containing protein 8-like [Corticium candelabrum]